MAANAASGPFDANLFNLNGELIYANGILAGRTYVATVSGKAVRYDISQESADALAGVLDQAIQIFERVEIAISGVSLAQLVRNGEQWLEDQTRRQSWWSRLGRNLAGLKRRFDQIPQREKHRKGRRRGRRH
jgi:hypothetical protein